MELSAVLPESIESCVAVIKSFGSVEIPLFQYPSMHEEVNLLSTEIHIHILICFEEVFIEYISFEILKTETQLTCSQLSG